MRQAQAFSLIELMVVIAIVALLAAVAVPSYKSYILKTKITNGYNAVNDLRQKLTLQYETTGSFPSSFTYGGVTVAGSGNYGAVNIGVTTNIRYLLCAVPNAIYTEVTLSGIDGVSSSYVTPPANASGSYASIRLVSILGSNGAYTTYCGSWINPDTNSIPLAYLPSTCTCVNLNTICNSGVVSNPC